MAVADTAPAPQEIPVVSQAEEKLRNDSGGFTASGETAGPAMVDTQTPAPQGAPAPAQPKKRPAYWDTPMGENAAKAAAPPTKYGGSPVSGYKQNLEPAGE